METLTIPNTDACHRGWFCLSTAGAKLGLAHSRASTGDPVPSTQNGTHAHTLTQIYTHINNSLNNPEFLGGEPRCCFLLPSPGNSNLVPGLLHDSQDSEAETLRLPETGGLSFSLMILVTAQRNRPWGGVG